MFNNIQPTSFTKYAAKFGIKFKCTGFDIDTDSFLDQQRHFDMSNYTGQQATKRGRK